MEEAKLSNGVAKVNLDVESYEFCVNRAKNSNVKLNCVDLSTWLPNVNEDQTRIEFGDCKYNLLVWTKPAVLLRAVEARTKGILLLDLDVLIHDDLPKWCREQNGLPPKGASMKAMSTKRP